MFRYSIGLFLFLSLSLIGIAGETETEPPLQKVFADLGITIGPEDEIAAVGPVQGLFYKTGSVVEVLLTAKYSFDKQDNGSNVRMGFYNMAMEPVLNPLFICGPEAGDQSKITGLPADPKGRYYFDPGKEPFGLFVQSANFNPEFSSQGETVFTQDRLNLKIARFGKDIHKVHIYPYKTQWETKLD